MVFRSHGHYTITLMDEGSIAYVEFIDEWNREAAVDFGRAFRECRLAPRWVAIADLRRFGGATPDMTEGYLPLIEWALEHGEAATGHVYKSEVQLMFVCKLAEFRSPKIPQENFTSKEDAIAWARNFLAK